MKYARIHGTDVIEICTPIEGFSIQECFHPSLSEKMVQCSDEVTALWSYNPETGEFIAPQESA